MCCLRSRALERAIRQFLGAGAAGGLPYCEASLLTLPFRRVFSGNGGDRMTEPRPSITRFVNAVVLDELARASGASESDVAQRILMRLHDQLSNLIGRAGFDVLLARSLVLARRAHPVLAGITAGPGGTLVGIDEATRDGATLQVGATAIVAHFIELLVVLIGEDLAMSLVRDVWPAAEEEDEKK